MASITQTIPSFTGGISQQPDELVLPGQVKDLVNGIPDITDGLVKRPGSRFINSLSGASTGTWFSYYRDASEGAYIGQVQRNGAVKIWHANDVYDSNGNKTDSAGDVAHSGSAVPYLQHSNDEDIKFLTIADTTFVTNVSQTVSVNTSVRSDDRAESIGDSNDNKYQAFVELRQLAHGREYSFNVASTSDSEVNITSSGEGRATSIVVDTPGGGNAPNGYQTINRGDGTTGINPNCQHQASEVFTVNSGSGKNLVFRLTATCQVVVRENMGNDTINGNDYVGVYNVTCELLNGGYGWRVYDGSNAGNDDTVTVQMRNVNYTVHVKSVQEIKAKRAFGFFRPQPSSFDANVEVSADSILSQVVKGTNVNSGEINLNVVEKIGNGLFLAHNSPFTVETSNPDLWRITPMEVNDASELPRQCKHGMILKVISSADSVDDDFYLKFVGNNNADGPGSWEECQGPGLLTSLDANTLPHIIQRQSDGSFTVGTYSYVARETGDNTTNPFPSLIKTPVSNNQGRKISQTFFHRNRLGFLCEDNVILSRAGEPGNFFQESSLVIGGSDPIDIQASSTQPTQLKSAIETNTGLVIFAETQQFLLHTDSDSLTPETGKLSNISTYRYSPKTEPVSLGTTLGFIDSAGVNGRFFEVFDIRREGEPNMVEQTKVAPKLLPHDLDVMTNSRENNTIFFSKSGTAEIFGYRYFNTGDKRAQSAWFKWTLPHNIAHLFVLDDELYIISSDYKLLKIALQKLDTSRDVVGDNFYENILDGGYSVHLDSSVSLTAGSYDGTYTTVSHSFTGTGTKLGAVNLSTGEVFMEDETQRSGSTYKFNGDFAGDTVVVGWLFELNVNLPRIYVKQKAGEITTSDVTASLTIQRVHLRFGPVGQIHVRLKRLGKDHIETTYESTPMDYYDADEATFVPEKTQTVPVYERNKNCNLVLKSLHPGPAQFISMTWEGDYTPMHHKRV
jgi:hypothetical protein